MWYVDIRKNIPNMEGRVSRHQATDSTRRLLVSSFSHFFTLRCLKVVVFKGSV